MHQIFKKDVLLAPYTTLHIGGSADYFVEVTTKEELGEAVRHAQENELPITVLGDGSNVLVADHGVRGLVIQMNTKGISFEQLKEGRVHMSVEAGEEWDALVENTVSQMLWGIENLSGIPGRVGAAPIQNINAYGVSVSDVIEFVEAYHIPTGKIVRFTRDECMFAYRNSFFKTTKGKEYIITQVTMTLSLESNVQTVYKSSSQSVMRQLSAEGIETPTPQDIRRIVLSLRRNIGMLKGMYQSAGSFFKNVILMKEDFERVNEIVMKKHLAKSEMLSPWSWELPDGKVKVSTAFLMECSPYNKTDFVEKLYNGAVGISPVHTLSLINVNNAHAKDVQAFASCITEAIQKEFDVVLESEVCLLK